MKKGKCSICHKFFTLTKNNTLRKHGHNVEPRNDGNGQRISDFCKGSNTLPFVSFRKWVCIYKGYDIEKNIIDNDFEVRKNDFLIIDGISKTQNEAMSFIDNLTKEDRA
jgi:hypothetical protein